VLEEKFIIEILTFKRGGVGFDWLVKTKQKQKEGRKRPPKKPAPKNRNGTYLLPGFSTK